MRDLAALAVGDQPAQRVLQVGAGVAAQAAVAEQRDLVAAVAQQRVVDADRAELVDDQRGAAPSGVVEERRTSVVLPAPRKPVTIVTGMRALPRSRF